MSTVHTSEIPAARLARQRRGSQETTHPNHEGAAVAELYATAVPAIVRVLASPSITVAIAEVPALQCEWCAEVDAVTTIRIYGQPLPDVCMPVEYAEVCGLCAPDLIDRAIAEADSRAGRLVHVEVAA